MQTGRPYGSLTQAKMTGMSQAGLQSSAWRIAANGHQQAPAGSLIPLCRTATPPSPPYRRTRIKGQAWQAAAGAAPRPQGHFQRQLRLGAQGGGRLLGCLAVGEATDGVGRCRAGAGV